jgi:hypothetical protein
MTTKMRKRTRSSTRTEWTRVRKLKEEEQTVMTRRTMKTLR